MERLIVIPARIGGLRFPDKVLAMHEGKTLLQYTWERACNVPNSVVVIATDDDDVLHTAQAFGASAILTGPTSNGTRKVAYAYRQLLPTLKNVKVVVNWQVDEPLLNHCMVNSLCEYFAFGRGDFPICTLTYGLPSNLTNNENQVKAIVSRSECLWFTRHFVQQAEAHVGLYLFKPTHLEAIATLSCAAARNQRLEQLGWLAHGYRIGRISYPHSAPPLSINVPEDWQEFCKDKVQCQSES